MKKNKMLRYFSNYTLYLIAGIPITVAGYLLWWYSWDLWRFGTPVMAIGAALVVVYFSLRITDDHYGEYMDLKLRAMPSDPERKPDYIFDGYSLDGNHFAKITKDGNVRSEAAIRTHIYLGKKLKMVIGIANAETDSAEFKEYEFANVTAEVENFEAVIKGNRKKLARMTVSSEGTEIAFPVKRDDIEVDQLCEKLKEKYR